MTEFLRNHQLNIMMGLSSICAIIVVFAVITTTLPKKRKLILIYFEAAAGLLLFFDRFAYIYRGDVSVTGYWMVRISNFMVFFLTVCAAHAFNLYMVDVCKNDMRLPSVPKRMYLAELMVVIGWTLIVVSQFTGFYYTFDEMNRYQRGQGFLVCYVMPMLIMIVQLSVTIQYYRKMSRYTRISLLLFTLVGMTASVIQIFTYGVSLTNMSIVGMAIVLYIFAIIDMNQIVARATQLEMDSLRQERKGMQKLFEQTISVIAGAIDAKDKYTRGHSARVAKYSREIARLSGKDEKTCDEVYYTALLHDVGKIGIPDTIITKDSGLTDEEYELIRSHPALGGELLSAISEYPYLSIGARFHHERYDGKGYPEGLRGNQIPEIARIVAVADTYDAMTSKRSYRDPLPQKTVREEIVKGSGTQFDPKYAAVMVDMIDRDKDYLMQDRGDEEKRKEITDLTRLEEMDFGEYRSLISDGIRLSSDILRICLAVEPANGADEKKSIPAIILFHSYDGCVHQNDREIKTFHYMEYGEIWLDGHTICTEARNMNADIQTDETEASQKGNGQMEETASQEERKGAVCYEIEAVKSWDHVRIRIKSPGQKADVIAALSDAGHAYIALTGEHCRITGITVVQTEESIDESYIPRIAEEISFTNRLEGDIPNVQIIHTRSAYTKGVPVADDMRLIFHTMSLPSANLIWNCAYVLLYLSEDGAIGGESYKELACIRLDGEDITAQDTADNELEVRKSAGFVGWDEWKEFNKKGFDCEVAFYRRKNRITMETENAGIVIRNVSTIKDRSKQAYVSLTGDQCVVTNVRVLL